MNTTVESVKYIVAVSGGVDSVVLLDLLAKQPKLELVVAHFDHGIRSNSKRDREFVATLSQKYRLPFAFREGNLGKDASEEQARKARYNFLRQVCKKYNAGAIVTAHHQDDVIETMFINIMRGTNRKGLSSLSSNTKIIRPLLQQTKKEIQMYAKANDLEWREDVTNEDTKYLRNWIRQHIVANLSPEQRSQLVQIYTKSKKADRELKDILEDMGASEPKIEKKMLLRLPHSIAKEYVAHWLRKQGVRQFDKKTIERITIGAKTLPIGKQIEIYKGIKVVIGEKELAVVKPSVAQKG